MFEVKQVGNFGSDDEWRDDSNSPAALIEVSHRDLSPDALRGVIESFVLREGTEYGAQDIDLDAKVRAVLEQLDAGEAIIVFEPAEQSVDIRVRGDPA